MKRTIWLAAGFGLGMYAGERMRRTVVKLTPEALGDRMRELLADAMEAGRAEMAARERSLRETFAAPERARDHGAVRSIRTAGSADSARSARSAVRLGQ